MGYSLQFKHEDKSTTVIEMSYGYNLYRNVFDPITDKGKSGNEMVIILNKALQHIEAKYPFRSSMRDLLKSTTGNLEILLHALLEDAKTHPDWIFHAE